jgi:hypothetical protein
MIVARADDQSKLIPQQQTPPVVTPLTPPSTMTYVRRAMPHVLRVGVMDHIIQ